jgi:nicotinate phosphoribosyltransferase
MNPLCSPLLTDLYELTMLQAYFERGMTETAVFELFVRKLPPKRDFLVAAGLEQALDFIEDLRFGDEELDWIRGCGHFKPAFADQLAKLRFTGDVHALPEGTILFPNEPLLRVTAPLPQASSSRRGFSTSFTSRP